MKTKSFLVVGAVFFATSTTAHDFQIANLKAGGVMIATVYADGEANGRIVNPAGFAYTLACGRGYVHGTAGGEIFSYEVKVEGGFALLTAVSLQQMLQEIAANPTPDVC